MMYPVAIIQLPEYHIDQLIRAPLISIQLREKLSVTSVVWYIEKKDNDLFEGPLTNVNSSKKSRPSGNR